MGECCTHCSECDRKKVRDEKEYKDLIHRLSRIEGQVRGIREMVESDRYCVDILTQVSAIQSALNSFNKVLLSSHIKSCVVEDIRQGKEGAVDELCKTIESKVRAMKGIAEDDEYDSVSATSMKSAIDALNSFMGAFSLIMGAVASISLLVGGIGIMNMMLTNVTERIREIGIRRALGASRRDITAQFLAESSALCVTGGLLGVLIGYLLAWGLTFFAASSGIMSEFGATGTITPSFSITTVLIAFAVSVGIGVIFGFYPARRAAKLDPVECLRYQ